jgi:Mg2+/Co2+ transporter CorC
MEAGEEPTAVRREDGSWLLAGLMPIDETAERVRIVLPAERGYQTVAGFVLQAMGRLPRAGEAVEAQGWRFEVVDLDGRRIDKVLAAPALDQPCKSRHSICRTVSDRSGRVALASLPRRRSAALKPGACGAPLRGCGA